MGLEFQNVFWCKNLHAFPNEKEKDAEWSWQGVVLLVKQGHAKMLAIISVKYNLKKWIKFYYMIVQS